MGELKVPEQELLISLSNGSEIAFTEIYERYKSLLHLEAFFKTHCQEEAEDIVHEVFTDLWRRRSSISIKISLKAYLFRAVHFQFVQRLRKSSQHKNFTACICPSLEPLDCFTGLENKDLGRHLNCVINALPSPSSRAVLKMAYLEEVSYKEIADSLEISVETARSKVSRALKALREKMKK